jgi:hypothetical protein
MNFANATVYWRAGILIAVLLTAPLPAFGEGTGKLDTPSFKITVEIRCPEGEVTCADVKYVGVNKKTGESITLIGKTAHKMAADGETPGRFLGYVFKKGDVTYFLSEEGELRVSEGDKVLLQEKGTWTW